MSDLFRELQVMDDQLNERSTWLATANKFEKEDYDKLIKRRDKLWNQLKRKYPSKASDYAYSRTYPANPGP
jgi:hypothetical protein